VVDKALMRLFLIDPDRLSLSDGHVRGDTTLYAVEVWPGVDPPVTSRSPAAPDVCTRRVRIDFPSRPAAAIRSPPWRGSTSSSVDVPRRATDSRQWTFLMEEPD
jgi:hypothetical protein